MMRRQLSRTVKGLGTGIFRPASIATVASVAILALAGCASGPQIPKEIRVPVPVSCIDQVPQRPSMLSDAELLALDDYGLVIALARDRRVRQGYIAELEATVAGCR